MLQVNGAWSLTSWRSLLIVGIVNLRKLVYPLRQRARFRHGYHIITLSSSISGRY